MVTAQYNDSLTRLSANEGTQSNLIEITFESEPSGSPNAIFRNLLKRSFEGLRDVRIEESIKPGRHRTREFDDDWRILAPGVMVRPEEYESRYSKLNLEDLRARMKPEIFQAFIRSIGTIRSIPDTDVNELTRQEGI